MQIMVTCFRPLKGCSLKNPGKVQRMDDGSLPRYIADSWDEALERVAKHFSHCSHEVTVLH